VTGSVAGRMRPDAEAAVGGGGSRAVTRVMAGIEEAGMNTTTSAFELAHDSRLFFSGVRNWPVELGWYRLK